MGVASQNQSGQHKLPHYRLYINGAWQPGEGGEYLRLNPASGQPAARFDQASRAQVEQVVVAARTAFDSGIWSNKDAAERAGVMLRFADLLIANQQRLAALETVTQGAPIKYTRSFIQSAADTFRYFAGLARDLHGHTHGFDSGRMGMTLREPVGVVSLILPWNFPIGELAWKLAPALAAGCTVVAKPDSKTAASALEAGPLLTQAGLPDAVFNVVVGDVAEIGEVLTAHPDVDAVSFTGSSSSGRVVMRSAAQRVKPLHLELGGKSALIIMNDADLDRAAADAAAGIFWHNGQVCTACSRLLVHERVHSAFTEKLLGVAAGMQLGDPLHENTELGPMIGPEHLGQVRRYIQAGCDEKASLAMDGRTGVPQTGAYLGPTVFTDVTPEMTIAREEIFGPVASVLKITNLEHAIALANDSEYGLGAGIWSDDINAALSAARRVRAGSFWINGYGGERLELPWGGYKQSGFGRELGREAFEVFLQTKSVHIAHQ